MSEVKVTEVEASEEQKNDIRGIPVLAAKLFNFSVENAPSYGILFGALSQTASTFMFQFLLATQGSLTKENVEAAMDTFGADTKRVALAALENYMAKAREAQDNQT